MTLAALRVKGPKDAESNGNMFICSSFFPEDRVVWADLCDLRDRRLNHDQWQNPMSFDNVALEVKDCR